MHQGMHSAARALGTSVIDEQSLRDPNILILCRAAEKLTDQASSRFQAIRRQAAVRTSEGRQDLYPRHGGYSQVKPPGVSGGSIS
jgi:hypothetical protein